MIPQKSKESETDPECQQKTRDENIVQWKQKNIKDGFIVVDEAQLSKLIKREPIEKYYKLEQEPFAKGLFASVRRCQSLDNGQSFAAKFSSREKYGEDCSAEIYHEIALLSLCGGGPRIVQIHDVFENEKEVILVMEYAPGGDLQTIIDDNMVPFESDVMSFVRQTVEGLEYLHRRKIAHLDIKPQNIVMMGDFPNCEIKLCDLEISRVILEEDKIRDFLGTPDYVAPEVIQYDPITLAADMWSLGVTTYVLLTGFTPFGGETDQETFCNISRGEVDFPEELFEDVSEEAIDFIKCLLVKNPSARPTASDCLKHPWLNRKVENNNTEKNVQEEVEQRQRKGCQTCQTPKEEECKHSLRKYLSKSREALFEKVIQQQKTNYTRKGPVNNQIFSRTRRLCESQISLLSKSRERLFNRNCSRSIEKLYGLRSLSKSQEVLNLYRNGSILTSQENLDKVSEILKSRENLLERMNSEGGEAGRDRRLIRAVTTDLASLHNREKPPRTYSGSSTTSLASITIDVKEDDEEKKEEKKRRDSEEEPRFTVAQLITAYNKHQEIVTKTSLEVTMTAQEKNVKIPPIIHYGSDSPFPTGPTALRLFIPDIDLVEVPKKVRPKPKIRFVESGSDISEPCAGDWEKNCVRSNSISSEASTMESVHSNKTSSSQEELVSAAAKEELPTPVQKRSKSASPSPPKKTDARKLSATEDSRRTAERRTKSPTQKTGSKAPKVPPSAKQTDNCSPYKIIGISGKTTRKGSGVSYKIEFESPTVTRKFPVRNIPTKGTISSNLKAKEPASKRK
ncbi:UNVERIFIED_CONTAM: hypothetical protein PYX00_010185 [Menopon gallinae]|uniref:Protein kinase domain-containing protein n=1 Tax=Menopon gallinae TaxID=328185 RepID=A0AAW2HEJ6_9NEOP